LRLLIIENAPDIAELLLRAFGNLGYAADAAPDGERGVELAEVNDYDLVVLDLNLPGIDGLEVCRRIRASRPQMLIVMLTARDQREDIIVGLDEGADDYLVKPFDFGELAARVRALLRRDLRVREPLLSFADLKLDPAARIAWRANRRLELTRKELGILEYLLRRPGEVVSQEELLEHVWDADANPFTNTVRVHINSLRRKLGDTAETPRYIETVVGAGYRLGAPAGLEERA
jgi:DNA-binding response OmpR family regulator